MKQCVKNIGKMCMKIVQVKKYEKITRKTNANIFLQNRHETDK